jgi:hypothetical protein
MLIQNWSLPAGVLIEGDGRCWWRCVRVARGDPLHIPAARAQPDPQRQPEQLRLPPLDLVCMNPPFTRTCGDNLLFGSLPETERTRMQKAFQEWCKQHGVEASITAGLGAALYRCRRPMPQTRRTTRLRATQGVALRRGVARLARAAQQTLHAGVPHREP